MLKKVTVGLRHHGGEATKPAGIDQDSVIEQRAGEVLEQPRRVCICPGRSITDQLPLFRHEAEEGSFARIAPRNAGLMDDCSHALARQLAQLVQISKYCGA